jgi:hypothetical protein
MEQIMTIQGKLAALGLAGALAIGASASASAGPLPVGTSAMSGATGAVVTDVRWRGHGGYGHRGIGPGIGLGLAAGALVGAAVAARPYGYGSGYYYEDAPAAIYAEPYAYETAPVYGPSYYGGYGYGALRGQCSTDEGYGRRSTCDSR